MNRKQLRATYAKLRRESKEGTGDYTGYNQLVLTLDNCQERNELRVCVRELLEHASSQDSKAIYREFQEKYLGAKNGRR